MGNVWYDGGAGEGDPGLQELVGFVNTLVFSPDEEKVLRGR